MMSFPPITWTESGQTSVLGESSSSRLSTLGDESVDNRCSGYDP
jgi:hypothetical protein